MNMKSVKGDERIKLKITAYCEMGNRRYMEDVYSVAYQKSSDGSNELEFAYFGMFDGHGGDTAAIFAKNHLMNFIVDQQGFWSNSDEEILKAIKTGFIECHMAMWRDLDNWPQTSAGLPSTAGTTASVAFIRKGKVYVGHCGDSGIVLGSKYSDDKWEAIPLTVDHKPENPEEKRRIEACGGKIIEKVGIHRVVWYRPRIPHQGPIRRNTRIEEIPFLAVARSLGDLWSYNWKTEKFMVSPEPDVAVYELDVTKHRCLIFASDGLWNIMDGQTAVDLVHEVETSNEESSKYADRSAQKWLNPARHLVEIALQRWRENRMRSDNTSVVCVMFDVQNKRNNNYENMEQEQNSRTIYDYSTSEAYNLDYIDMNSYDAQPNYNNLVMQNAFPYYHQNHFNYGSNSTSNQLPSFNSAGYQSYSHTSYSIEDHQMPSTSSSTADLTFHTSSNESAFIKGCCPNERYFLAKHDEQVHYHETYDQHKEMYQNMAQQKFPPLHYAYQPVVNPDFGFKLPSINDDAFTRNEIYRQNFLVSKPMDKYNYLRPTEAQLAEIHNEMENMGEEDELSDTDTEEMEWSDEDKTEENLNENNIASSVSQESPIDEPENFSNQQENFEKPNTADDSIQIFEISSSNLGMNEKSSKLKSLPERSNNKENSESPVKKKKINKSFTSPSRYYETRQMNCKMRSGNIRISSASVASLSGIQKTIGKEKSQRRIAKSTKRVVKSIQHNKASTSMTIKNLAVGIVNLVSAQNNNSNNNNSNTDNNNKTTEKGQNNVQSELRILRSSQTSSTHVASNKKAIKEKIFKVNVMRNLRSKAISQNEKSNLKKTNGKLK